MLGGRCVDTECAPTAWVPLAKGLQASLDAKGMSNILCLMY